jgi:pimeloyl-ACP methyl ester carboxylesterase
MEQLSSITTSQLEIAYHEIGDKEGWPCILNHGFPYDVHCYDECVKGLIDAGAYVIVPYLRGYGPTRFLFKDTLRSGEQAALANDLLELMDALSIEKAVLAGYDWGGRAACIVAALWPDRVSALVSGNAYNIQNIPRSMEPAPASEEARFWYQYYFHSERGRLGLEANRREIARLLWQMWSPTWNFSEAEFEVTAASFDNPDFVEVVVHSYRHRFGLVAGDPAVSQIERQLEKQPDISVATITIDGNVDGVNGGTAHHTHKFTGPHQHRVFDQAGHNLPQEKPREWVQAILDARQLAN